MQKSTTVQLTLRGSPEIEARLKNLLAFCDQKSWNKLGTLLLEAALDVVEFPGGCPPLPAWLIRARKAMHGFSNTYVDEPSSSAGLREDPTVEERRADNLAELALLDRILGLNEKLQNQVLDLQAQLLECRKAQDRLRDENQQLREELQKLK
jgi:hypothetical protein